jgi:flagellar basal body-associated protein FliL
MSEETQEHSDGTWSGLKKTILGTLTTVIAGGGVWVSTILFNGSSDEKEEVKTEQVAPAAPVIINLENNNTNQQKQTGATNTVIRERVIEKAAPAKEAKKSETEESPW